MPIETMVRTYPSSSAFAKEAKHLARSGWSVQSSASRQGRPGCARWLFLGLLAPVFKPKPELVVTYQRQRP
jgi:hypothetical protein